MDFKTAPRVIAIEEHYLDCGIGAKVAARGVSRPVRARARALWGFTLLALDQLPLVY
jgi:hypothetical protein